jgi:hypothetical protein
MSDSEKLSLVDTSQKNVSTVSSYLFEKERDDFPSLGIDLLKKINFKVAIFLFAISFLLNSDIFIEKVLTKFKNAVNGDLPTSKGIVIQLVMLTIGYIIIDLFVQSGVL